MKGHVSRYGELLGGYVPSGILQGIEEWITKAPERDKSTFIREAAREKLRREKIEFSEQKEVVA